MRSAGVCLCAGVMLLFCGCAKEVKKNSERSVRVETANLKEMVFVN
jgi:hypothetical protein